MTSQGPTRLLPARRWILHAWRGSQLPCTPPSPPPLRTGGTPAPRQERWTRSPGPTGCRGQLDHGLVTSQDSCISGEWAFERPDLAPGSGVSPETSWALLESPRDTAQGTRRPPALPRGLGRAGWSRSGGGWPVGLCVRWQQRTSCQPRLCGAAGGPRLTVPRLAERSGKGRHESVPCFFKIQSTFLILGSVSGLSHPERDGPWPCPQTAHGQPGQASQQVELFGVYRLGAQFSGVTGNVSTAGHTVCRAAWGPPWLWGSAVNTKSHTAARRPPLLSRGGPKVLVGAHGDLPSKVSPRCYLFCFKCPSVHGQEESP